MSASSSSSLKTPHGDPGTREALIIGAALMAMLVFLAALRFGCNIFIDIVILDEMERARRSLADAIRFFCPWWHVRTQPTNPDSVEMSNGNSTLSPASPIALMTTKILTKTDLQEHKAKYNHQHPRSANNHHHGDDVESISSSNHSLMCSICLHELQEGDCAFIGDCNHIFHKDCMSQWVECRGRDCPNCRCEIVIPGSVAVDVGDTPPPLHD